MTIPSSRTVTLPVNPGASWDDFAWDPKYPGDSLDYTLDCQDWLAEAGRVIVSATMAVSAGLTVVGSTFALTGNAKTSVVLQLADGVPLTVAQASFALALDNGRSIDLIVALPIRAALPSGLVPYMPTSTTPTIGGTRITIGGTSITI